MNNINEVSKRHVDDSKYDYGLSTLYAWIKCLECLLHIGYRLDVRKWRINNKEEKKILETKQKHIQNNLRAKLGLLIDIPKPGYGTTNDGNTARRFFQNFEIASSITGINVKLIKRFEVILQTMSCKYSINIEAFRIF